MDNVTFFEFPNSNGEMEDHVLIDHGGGHFTSMTKETYDAQQESITSYVTPTFSVVEELPEIEESAPVEEETI